jgi:hypothetical protein
MCGPVVDDRRRLHRVGTRGDTDHAARWATVQVGRLDRTVNEVAGARGCDWRAINYAVVAYGEAWLDADVERGGQVHALGWRRP